MNHISNDNVVFRLVRPYSANIIKDHFGNSRIFPRNFSIAAEAEVIHNGEIRVIRYMLGQKSIFADEQVTDKTRSLSTKIEKPNFQNGILLVPRNYKTLLDFLRKHPSNEENADYGLPNQKIYFREHKPHELARKLNEENKSKASAMRLVYESDFKTKIVPLARYLGYDIDRDSDLIMFDMINFAQNNPADFVELINSVKIERYDEVCEAVKRGIISYTQNAIKWRDGRNICSVPKNYEPLDYFSEISFEKDYSSTWGHIMSEMRKQGYGVEDEELLSETKTSKQETLEKYSATELFEAGLNSGDITFKFPSYELFGNKIKGKEKTIEFISENDEIKNLLVSSLM